jgi:prevent-host-death family protein
MNVKSIGIRELKAHLSKYLRDVKNGGVIVVSERGRVIAQIVPVRSGMKGEVLRSILLKLLEENKIILTTVSTKPSRPQLRKKFKGTPFSDTIIEGRR